MKTKLSVFLFAIILCLSACTGGAGNQQSANVWQEINRDKATSIYKGSFVEPQGAQNVRWNMLRPQSGNENIPGTLIELLFELDGDSFTAREQKTGDETADISGINYDWTVSDEFAFSDSKYKDVKGKCYRYIGEKIYVDLCNWYDPSSGISYSLSITSKDLDGFDITAVAQNMMP